MKQRLDTHERFPAGMEDYLSTYGWHFSKKMTEWAISKMRDRKGVAVKMRDKDALLAMLKEQAVDVSDIVTYDAVYVDAMVRADYYGSSITTDAQLAKFIGDYLNDPDGYDGVALTRFYADCVAKGMPIYWEDML